MDDDNCHVNMVFDGLHVLYANNKTNNFKIYLSSGQIFQLTRKISFRFRSHTEQLHHLESRINGLCIAIPLIEHFYCLSIQVLQRRRKKNTLDGWNKQTLMNFYFGNENNFFLFTVSW